jgi:hypothetical protein
MRGPHVLRWSPKKPVHAIVYAECTVRGVYGHYYVRERLAGQCGGNEVAMGSR